MSERFWNRRAEKYDELAQADESYTRAVERFATYLTPQSTVLDFGCGTGVVAFKIAADVQEVLAIDTSSGMIDLASERAREREVANVRFERKTIFDEKLRKGSYDVILAFNILHLLEDAGEAVRRVSDLLKPEGLIVSETPCFGDAPVVQRTLLTLIGKLPVLPYLRKLRISDVKDLIQDGEFQILETEVLAGKIPSLFVVARKR